MNAPHPAKVAGIDSTVPSPAHTVASAAPGASPVTGPAAPSAAVGPDAPGALLQDRLAGWVSDLTTLHELTERLVRTDTLSEALDEVLRAGAALVGARRGLVVLEPADGLGPDTTVGLGLGRADLGHLETVPRGCLPHGRILDGLPVGEDGVAEPDLLADKSLDPRHREVAARLGYAASYALPLSVEGTAASTAGTGPSIAGTAASTGSAGMSAGGAGVSTAGPRRLGAAVWFYDEPAEPGARPRHLAGLYTRYAAQHLARLLEVERTRTAMATMAGELLPSRLPRVSGVQLAARHRTGPLGGGDWYDALPLPDAALGLAVGSVTGSGPSAVAAMGRLRASLRAYAVMEGEDPVAVLSDLELLLRLTEPARSATALFGYCEPALRRITLAGAGHSPPLLVGERRTEFVETSVSAPLGMLACWEAPSVELQAEPGETVLLYTDGLLHRTGDPADRAFARLHAAAAGVPRAARHDPDAVAEHVLRTVLPGGKADADSAEDVVLLAVRFA
ncbi:PP2C family protein-serine/threonine phosphatase [Streptomyces sp. STCH 565 A]|uniref:PP2C family protein-serine/threonine phosphatase n=1 Tax=Streptomyces sp. STCH 565 A TaxID=2950532 RepID=UPI002075361D|nr:PP2C family protein-serine/threonine phosphatase [Streptomyces sp. STCH 565 A]MCM8550357.1 serine/threonine-protein phosphatase [Streptomyces sp. STCH 565 A]